jgi:hypothetical protein
MEAEDLLKKIRALEIGQAELEREIGRLVPEAARRSAARPRRRPPTAFPPSSSRRAIAAFPHTSSRLVHRAARLSDRHCHWILQSLGQAVHIIAPNGKLLYW